jgi:serine-type D-Ala-D-Ala carboxypeptidase (penicillin-binding protein 5/6)
LASRLILACLLLLCAPAWAQPGALPRNPFPDAATAYLVAIDGNTVWDKQPHRHLPAASLTKLMTALLVAERNAPKTGVNIDPAAAQTSRLGFRIGETFRTRDLLAAMLIASDNGACHALADAIAGSETHFVQQMNRRARQLGMRDTRYADACGRDAAQQHSSAHDLALLANALIKYPEITALTAKRGMRIATLDGKHSVSFASRNGLIGRYPGVRGLKTGYTRRAGRCQAIYAERDGHQVLLIMLHARRWGDAVDILDLAFDRAIRK